MNATGTYKPTKWDEKDVHDVAPQKKITKASVEFTVTGEIDGIASLEYLMYYNYSDPNDQHKSDAKYMGLVQFNGKLGGRSGSFAMEDTGTFRNGVASSKLAIFEGSGTGELTGIKGSGNYSADKNGATMNLDYELA